MSDGLRFHARRLLLPAEGDLQASALIQGKWDRDLPARRRRGDYRDGDSLCRSISGQFSRFTRLLNGDIEGGRHNLLFWDFAFFYGESLIDLGQWSQVAAGTASEARFLQQVLLNTTGLLDDLYRGGLQERIGSILDGLLVTERPVACAPPESFRNMIAGIAQTYATLSDEVYALVLRSAP
ncbi:MAG: hypothetical protein IT368_18780 [Candidatus Hydrogenedentes bacterium]|nr:hypothetical protein [Candidatus Hydrogenedentota bacterium]